eukprot:255526_1
MSFLIRYFSPKIRTIISIRTQKTHFSSSNFIKSKCKIAWEHSSKSYKDNIAVIQDDHKITYQELDERINSLCYMLQNQYNLKKGDKLMHLSTIRIDDLQIVLACFKLGLLYMAINPSFTAKQLANIAQKSEPSLIITEPQFIKNIELIDPAINKIQITDEFDPNNWLSDEFKHLQYIPDVDDIQNDDPLQVCFTSGTTGVPKGCVHSHNSIYQGAISVHCNFIGPTIPNKDATLALTPLTGIPAIIQRLSVLFEGSTIIYPNKHKAKSAKHWHELCEYKHKSISRAMFFGGAMSDIYHLNKKFNHLDAVLFTGDFTPFKTLSYLKKNIFAPHTKFINGYGLTESHWISHLDPIILEKLINENDSNANINVPVGTPISDAVKIKIANDGEIMIKKEDNSSMIGYLNAPDL